MDPQEMEELAAVGVMSEGQRRDSTRVPAHGHVILTWSDTEGRQQAAEADLLNESTFGLGLRTKQSLESGQELWIRGGSIKLKARVQHVTLDGGDFVVGIQVAEEDLPR